MNKTQSILPIGVFDSGIGGISVLSEMLQALPDERFIYVADSANAPYGTKSCECVRGLSLRVTEIIAARGVKALVVACNTATSVAITDIRERYAIPVIGMEPALKPAVESGKDGKIVVMATPLTLKEEKFNSLFSRLNTDDSIIPVPCGGLAELIESEDEPGIKEYLRKLWLNIPVHEVSAVVLGCTHYCFIKNDLQEIIGPDISIVDGNTGTVRHLHRTLQAAGLINAQHKAGQVSERVEFISTGQDPGTIELCRKFMQKYMQENKGKTNLL